MAKEAKQDSKPDTKPESKKKGGGKKGAADQAVVEPPPSPRLKQRYDDVVRKRITEQFGITNPMAMPRVEKVTVNINMGRHLEGTKLKPEVRQTVLDTIATITGQKPVVNKAKKSVSNFKVRAGLETSAMVTLRRDRMWHFLDRFIHLACPRIKDFRGLPDQAFDRQGNYSLGLQEQGVFPEINMAEAVFTHGMNINVTLRNSDAAKSKFVLEELGMPFRRPEKPLTKSPTPGTPAAPAEPA
jgi:large subunit ribosomal protein L5